jgi:acetyltransferase-like isoleucine patch superfamily enzyme
VFFLKKMAALKYQVFLKQFQPEIIGYKNEKGESIAQTGISNVSHVANRNNLKIGKNVRIGHFNYIDSHKEIEIDKGCQISNYVSILTHSTHHNIRFRGQELCEDNDVLLVSKAVKIGAFTYIGPHSVIMPGSSIGRGCIVSAYSLVSGHFPDYSIIKGQPAKVIGSTKDIDLPFLENHPEFKNVYYERDTIPY